ncbi:MAG: hypothetical protein OXF54_20880 [Caldilineaceae bacterium]|nr:hypothetical protein [Caldilineaceae bacterium]
MKAPRLTALCHGLTEAVFLVGLAVLFLTNLIWPGILVLVAVTGLVEVLLGHSEPNNDDIPLPTDRSPEDEQNTSARYAAQ